MFCPACGSTIQPGQKFCTECGGALVSAAPGAPLPPPSWGPTPDPSDATAALKVVEQTSPTGYEPSTWDSTATQQMPAQGGDTGNLPVTASAASTFRITPLVAVSALAGVVSVAAAFVEVASYEVAGDFVDKQTFKLNDFASNLTVGVIIAAVLLIAGSALGATGRRVGSGLAGGAGLAVAGAFGWVIGQVTMLFDGRELALLAGGGTFTLTTTQEIGFWLAVVAAGLGVLAFILSLTAGGNDGWPVINPAVGVLGALGTLAVVIGPLIPMNGASFGDNIANDLVPPATLYLRLAALLLIGIGGVVGFLANRRWGYGMALGAISVGAWQWATAIGEVGDYPLGIAGANVGATDLTPHVVTSVGVVVMLIAGAAGLLMAAQHRSR